MHYLFCSILSGCSSWHFWESIWKLKGEHYAQRLRKLFTIYRSKWTKTKISESLAKACLVMNRMFLLFKNYLLRLHRPILEDFLELLSEIYQCQIFQFPKNQIIKARQIRSTLKHLLKMRFMNLIYPVHLLTHQAKKIRNRLLKIRKI